MDQGRSTGLTRMAFKNSLMQTAPERSVSNASKRARHPSSVTFTPLSSIPLRNSSKPNERFPSSSIRRNTLLGNSKEHLVFTTHRGNCRTRYNKKKSRRTAVRRFYIGRNVLQHEGNRFVVGSLTDRPSRT